MFIIIFYIIFHLSVAVCKMKREGSELRSPPSPKIARLSTSQESGEDSSGNANSLSEVTSSWLSTAGESSQGLESGVSGSYESAQPSGNSLESEDPSTESSGSGERSLEDTGLSGAARTTAITDLPKIISTKYNSLTERNSLASASVRSQQGDTQMQNLSGTSTLHHSAVTESREFMRASPTSENMMLTCHDSPTSFHDREDLERPTTSLSMPQSRLSTLQRTRESPTSHFARRESPLSFDSLRRQMLSGSVALSRDKVGVGQANPGMSFGQGQTALVRHANAMAPLLNTADYHHSSSNAQAPVALPANMASYSMAHTVNSIPRLASNIHSGGSAPHHSLYETSSGSLFRDTASRSQSPSSSLSPSSLRMPLSRPDGVSLVPRRKSHSESTVTR